MFTEAHETCMLLDPVLACTVCILWDTRVGLCSRLGFSLILYSIMNFLGRKEGLLSQVSERGLSAVKVVCIKKCA